MGERKRRREAGSGRQEANSSETFSRVKGDLSHKSTYKRKLSRTTMINKKC